MDWAHGPSEVAATDAVLIGCAVSGTVKPARDGALFGFAGGTPHAFTAALRLLSQLCRGVELIGATGAGASVKLAVGLLLTVFWQALPEACSLIQEVPIEPGRLVDLLVDSNIGASILNVRGGLVAAALAGEATGAASFDVDFMRMDLRDMPEDGKALGVSLPVAARTLACFEEASHGASGRIDATEYPAWWVKARTSCGSGPVRRDVTASESSERETDMAPGVERG